MRNQPDLTQFDERTLVKLVVVSASQWVLGAHMVGAVAPEIIQGLAITIYIQSGV